MNKNTSKNLLKYSAAAGAILATAGISNAEVHYGQISTDGASWGDDPITAEHDGEIQRIYIDLDGDGLSDFYFKHVLTNTGTGTETGTNLDLDQKEENIGSPQQIGYWQLYGNGSSNPYKIAQSTGNTGTSWYDLIKFEQHDMISDQFARFSQTWATVMPIYEMTNGVQLDVFPEQGGLGYAGVYFQGQDGEMHYGWIKMDANKSTGKITVYECAFEKLEDYPIAAGDMKTVPLTPLASLAGMGIIGLAAALKRRRKNK